MTKEMYVDMSTKFPRGCALESPAGVKVSWVSIPSSRTSRI